MLREFLTTWKSRLHKKKAGSGKFSPLVKPRPSSLEQNYLLASDGPIPDEAFRRLWTNLFDAINRARERTASGRTIFKEKGKLPGGRPYIYLQPKDERGYLLERSGSGWVLSRADKIVDRGLFLRDYEVIDQVNLYYARDGRTYPRVKSVGPKSDLVSFAIYEQRLGQILGLVDEKRRG